MIVRAIGSKPRTTFTKTRFVQNCYRTIRANKTKKNIGVSVSRGIRTAKSFTKIRVRLCCTQYKTGKYHSTYSEVNDFRP